MGEQIENQAKLEYTNSSSDNKVEKESEKPEVHTGGVVLYKYYSVNDKKISLAGKNLEFMQQKMMRKIIKML